MLLYVFCGAFTAPTAPTPTAPCVSQVLANRKGEQGRRQWIVFDGDVDPEWAENLNSVLDDNKMLTLPSGERLELLDNVRIMLEVKDVGQGDCLSVCGVFV